MKFYYALFFQRRVGEEFSNLTSNMNEEWKHMFGTVDSASKPGDKPPQTSWDSPPSAQHSVDIEYSLQERSYIQCE